MEASNSADAVRHCTFCKKSQHETDTMITGPAAAPICETCARQCGAIIQQAGLLDIEPPPVAPSLPKPGALSGMPIPIALDDILEHLRTHPVLGSYTDDIKEVLCDIVREQFGLRPAGRSAMLH